MDSSEASSKVPSFQAGKNPFWDHGTKVNPKDTNRIKCNYCGQVCNGRIIRFKHHLGGVKGNIRPCPQVPAEVRGKAEAALGMAQASKKAKSTRLQADLDEVVVGLDEEEEDTSQHRGLFSGMGSKGPMDKFVQLPLESFQSRKGKEGQSTIDSKYKKKARDDACLYVARWAYETGVPFNALYSPSFQQMLHAVGQCGPGMKGPTPYEMREKFLQMEVQRTKEALLTFTQTCRLNGCSLLTDAWTDRKGRSIMNIVVHCSSGTAFWLSKNVSSSIHDGKFIFDFVEEAISSPDGPGEENVVQIVTDNAASNMAASRMLALTRPRIFWTSCAAHTLNLLLGDIGKQKQIKNAISMGRQLTVFIYGHTISLDMFREVCKDLDSHELVRPGVTRFATAFLSLQSILEKKRQLREMFSSAKWEEKKLAHSTMGKQVGTFVLSGRFWRDVELAVAIFTPLVKVLRRADGDTPSMGWLYGDMRQAKEEVATALDHKESKYLPIWKLIDSRWEKKLSSPLHLAGYFLNPYFYYPRRDEIDGDPKYMGGILGCMSRMYANDPLMQDRIPSELDVYQFQQGLFGKEMAKRQRQNPSFNSVHWWKLHGIETPHLRAMAMRILSLTTSSSGCERNWSTFEMIHSKKRNRLESKRLNDLVFVKFNAMLQSKHSDPSRDPIAAKSLDEGKTTEWMVGSTSGPVDEEEEDEVFPGEGLTWRQIGEMMDDDIGTRRSSRPQKTMTIAESSSSRGKRKVSEMEEEEDLGSWSSRSDEDDVVPTAAAAAMNPDLDDYDTDQEH